MAGSTTHFIHNLIVAGVTTGISVATGLPLQPVIYANIAGIVFTPDIDMEQKTGSERVLGNILAKIVCGFNATKKRIKRVERVFSAILMSVTAPYAFLFPHRSMFTHLPPLSVIVQMMYFYIVYVVLCRVINYDYWSVSELYNNYQWFLSAQFLTFFAVLNAHHLAHLIGDGGMILVNGKRRYIFGKAFYNLSRKMFPQDARD